MKRTQVGQYVISIAGGEEVRAFIPGPLSPTPRLDLSESLGKTLDQCLLALGRLDGAAATLPDVHLLLYTYIRRSQRKKPTERRSPSTVATLELERGGHPRSAPLADGYDFGI